MIFGHTNYRSYLREFADQWREDGKSMRALAEHCGFSSPNFVQQIIERKRNLTLPAAKKIATALELSDPERQYLLKLVELSRSKGPLELEQNLKDLKRMVGRSKKRSVKDSSIYDSWLYGAVFEMFKTNKWSDPAAFAEQPLRGGVTEKQLDAAFRFLVDKGYLAKSEAAPNGHRWQTADVSFVRQNDVRRINGQQNHLKFLGMAQHRIADDLEEREYQGLTFSVKSKRLGEVKERIRGFMAALDEEFAEDRDGDAVMRLQVCLFRLTK